MFEKPGWLLENRYVLDPNALSNGLRNLDIPKEINRATWAMPTVRIKNVIFNAPATIVFWSDETKTVVKCGKNDEFDPEKGLAMAIAKKVMGNTGHYYQTFRKWAGPKMKKREEAIQKELDKITKEVLSYDERRTAETPDGRGLDGSEAEGAGNGRQDASEASGRPVEEEDS